jgi:hypothetical protein
MSNSNDAGRRTQGALDYCIERLEAEYKRDLTESRRTSIMDVLQVIKEMRAALVLRQGVSSLE